MTPVRSLGILETRGMAALMGATDAMLKVADVSVCGRHGIGSGWVTIAVEGDVDAVEAALSVGRQEAAARGEVIFADVIARPDGRAAPRMSHVGAVKGAAEAGREAVGLLETRGMVPLIVGTDAMAKAAPVDLAGWTYIGGALAHTVVRGDVASVKTAVEAGARAAGRAGELYATLVIPGPAAGIGALFPPGSEGSPQQVGGLGLVETTGYVSAVGAADGAVKAADIQVLGLTIGSGGRVVTLFSGDLDGVQAAVSDGQAAAEEAGQLEAGYALSRPDPATMALFGRPVPSVRQPAGPHLAMGLVETRSTVALVKAVDRMLKAADVTFEGRYKVGYFLTAGVIRGDVGAVRAALEAGAAEAEQYGELVSAHLIPQPYESLEECLAHV